MTTWNDCVPCIIHVTSCCKFCWKRWTSLSNFLIRCLIFAAERRIGRLSQLSQEDQHRHWFDRGRTWTREFVFGNTVCYTGDCSVAIKPNKQVELWNVHFSHPVSELCIFLSMMQTKPRAKPISWWQNWFLFLLLYCSRFLSRVVFVKGVYAISICKFQAVIKSVYECLPGIYWKAVALLAEFNCFNHVYI